MGIKGTYSLYIDYYSANGYEFTTQVHLSGWSENNIKTSITNSSYFCRKDAFVSYWHWFGGPKIHGDCN